MSTHLSAQAALWFLPFVLPIALWVAFSDMKWMKIQNKAVLALTAVYLLVGFLALPMNLWLWGWLHLGVVLVIGFVLSLTGMIGAGDAKFAAAMAPFIALGDLSLFLPLLGAVSLMALTAHRIARRVPAVRRAAPGWESWERREFPMGLALGPALLFYLIIAAVYGG